MLKIAMFMLMILFWACQETESLNKTNNDKKDNKDSISSCCDDIFSYTKNYFRSGRYGLNYSMILQSESKNFNFKNIRGLLIAQKVLFPLNFKHIFIEQVEVGHYKANSLLYIDFKNQDEFFMYYFEFINPPLIYYCEREWYNSLLTSKQKKELINKCLEVNNYCVIVVKILWKPYLAHLKSIEAVDRYKDEKGIYDSLQKVWNKQDLINKQEKK